MAIFQFRRSKHSTSQRTVSPLKVVPATTRDNTSAAYSIIDSLGAEAVSQTVNAISAVIANAPKRLIERVRRVSPDLSFDFAKKFWFSQEMFEFVNRYFENIENISDDDVREFLTQCRNIIDDHAHLLELDDYKLHKRSLARLRADDRAALEDFYTSYFVSIRKLNRVLFRELAASASENETASSILVGLFDQALGAIRDIRDLCQNVANAGR